MSNGTPNLGRSPWEDYSQMNAAAPTMGPGGGFPGAGQAVAGMAGDVLGGIFGTGQEEMNQRNKFKAGLANQLARDPFGVSSGAAKWDVLKSQMGEGSPYQQAISPEAWKNLGSTNENLLGQNATIEDFLKMADFEKQSWWKKALGAAVPLAIGGASKLFGG